MSAQERGICVIGSYAVGMTMSCQRFPHEGETVLGKGFQVLHGGKGSNQAIAVARLGGRASFMTALGEDPFGDSAMKMLALEGIDTTFVRRMAEASTGVGFVVVAESGNNEIVIDFGANNLLSAKDVDTMAGQIAKSRLVLLQLEVNAAAVIRAIDLAFEKGTPIILNPAPFQALPDASFEKATYLTPNETEAAAMLGLPAGKGPFDGRELAARVHERFKTNAIVTLGELGVHVRTDTLDERVKAPKCRVVDSTGAGDVFSGALAVAIAEGRGLREAAAFAVEAASMSVEVQGVVESIPKRCAVDARQKRTS